MDAGSPSERSINAKKPKEKGNPTCGQNNETKSSQTVKVVNLYGPTSPSFTTMLVAYLERKSIVCKPGSIENKPEFLARKFIGELPVLLGEDHTLFGTREIIMYYAEQNKNAKFKEKVKQWPEPELNNLLFLHAFAESFNDPNDKECIERSKEELRTKLIKYDRQFSKKTSCSLADLMHLPTIDFIVENAVMSVETANLKTWLNRISTNPEWNDV